MSQTLANKIMQKRNKAKYASDRKISDEIWSNIQKRFEKLSEYTLEVARRISIVVTKKESEVLIEVLVLNYGEFAEQCLDSCSYKLSFKKLERMMHVMEMVTEKAKEEGLSTCSYWNAEDDPFWCFEIQFIDAED